MLFELLCMCSKHAAIRLSWLIDTRGPFWGFAAPPLFEAPGAKLSINVLNTEAEPRRLVTFGATSAAAAPALILPPAKPPDERNSAMSAPPAGGPALALRPLATTNPSNDSCGGCI